MIRLLLAVIVLSASAGAAAQPRVDFSGEWVAQGPEAFALLRFVPRTVPRGPESVSGPPSISIQQTAARIVLSFPGERRNVLTRPAFVIDDAVHEVVENRGDFWTKYVMRAAWAGESLVLDATSFSGWWKIRPPEAVHSAPSQYETTFELSMDERGETLTLLTTVADEKFEAQFRQLYSRARTPR